MGPRMKKEEAGWALGRLVSRSRLGFLPHCLAVPLAHLGLSCPICPLSGVVLPAKEALKKVKSYSFDMNKPRFWFLISQFQVKCL